MTLPRDAAHPDRPAEAEAPAPEPGPLAKLLAVLLLAIPVAGTAFHVFLYLGAPAAAAEYGRGIGLRIAVGIAFANLLGSWIHWRRTGMKIDLASRIASYIWIVSIVLILRAAYPEMFTMG